jgi:hypothetical protein
MILGVFVEKYAILLLKKIFVHFLNIHWGTDCLSRSVTVYGLNSGLAIRTKKSKCQCTKALHYVIWSQVLINCFNSTLNEGQKVELVVYVLKIFYVYAGSMFEAPVSYLMNREAVGT